MYKRSGVLLILQVFASVCLFVSSTRTAAAQDDAKPADVIRVGRRTYGVLQKSSDGRYALVWGFRNKQLDFARFGRDEAYQDSVLTGDPQDTNVIDAIIDCRRHRFVASLNECHHTPRLGHSSITTIWAHKGTYVAVYWDAKWGPYGIYVATLSGPHTGNVTDLLPKLNHALDRVVSAATRGTSIPSRDNHDVECELAFDSASRLGVNVSLLPYKLNPVPSYGVILVFIPTKNGVFGTRDPSLRGAVKSLD